MSVISVPDAWRALLAGLSTGPAAVMAVGGPDSGKTTFCRWLAAELARQGHAVWLVDADIGQQGLGPPTTVGCAPVGGDGGEKATAFFVGDVSPPGVIGPLLGAFAEAVREAREGGAERLVVDTTGWVADGQAVALKVAKAALLGEAHVVLISAGHELRAYRRAWRGLARFPTRELAAAPEVVPRTAGERRAYREARLAEHLRGAVDCTLELAQVAASGSGQLGLARPSLRPGLLLGLNDHRGRLLTLGLLRGLDGARGTLSCWCRPEGARATEVRLGRLCVAADGSHSSLAGESAR
jgi:polynucleotide 5'-hydroxyl-kinase GRC3/NOL9